ncbi:MAG TPA: acetate--CoA ligase family protein [Ruminiclostridium sp.]
MQFSQEQVNNMNNIFKVALTDGRNSLYEFEVYQLLKEIGLDVPGFLFIKDPNEVNEVLLKNFKQPIVVKIVSPQIIHKQKLGGVKIIRNTDPLFVQFVLSRMKEEILSHFTDEEKPEINGFLITEFIPYTQSLGYEVLLGFKEDFAFGPVLTLSKGGDDAEFFAKYYDSANLFIPPLNFEDAKIMVDALNIKHKFEQIGHVEYMDFMSKAASILSSLAYHYSFISENKPEYIIESLDINPFVITEDGKFIAIDGFAQFSATTANGKVVPDINIRNLDAIFHPTGVAVIGVSNNKNKVSLGRDLANLLHDLGRKDLYLVNSNGGTITFGDTEYKFYSSINEIEANVDLAVYAAPSSSTIDFISSMKTNIPKAIILISGIPSNIKYSDFAKQLDAVIPKDLRIIGPNCMGVFYAPDNVSKGLNTLFVEEKRLEVKYSDYSNCVLLTQSGALAVTEIDKLQNCRLFKSVVSFGNKYDVDITDLMAYFAQDDSFDLISLYIEGLDIGEGRKFYQLASQIKKPIIVYKAGRTEAGARAAASHTASMSGSYDVFKAACLQAGVILAENIEDHYNYVKVFSLLAHKIPKSNRVAGVVNAGFESTIGADELKNLEQAKLSVETIEKLNQINKYGLVDTTSPFLDITPMADDKMYADYVEAVLQDESVDCVFVAIVPHAVTLKTIPENCKSEGSLANLLVNLSKKYSKPMVVSVNAGRYYQDFVSVMEQNGLPVFSDIRSAIKSLDRFVTYHIDKFQK